MQLDTGTRDTGKTSISFKRRNHRRNRKGNRKLSSENAFHNGDIPTRTFKEDTYIFVDFLCQSINATIKGGLSDRMT